MNRTGLQPPNDESGFGNQVVSKPKKFPDGLCRVCYATIQKNFSCETCKEFFEDNFGMVLRCTDSRIKGPYRTAEKFCQCDSCWYYKCKKAGMRHTRQDKLSSIKNSQRTEQNSKLLEQRLFQPQFLRQTGQSLQSSVISDFQPAAPGNLSDGHSSSTFDNKQQPSQLQAPPNTTRESAFISHESFGANSEDETVDSTSDSQEVLPDFFADFLKKVFSDGSEVTEETESNHLPVSDGTLNEEIRKFRVKVKQCFEDAKKIKISGGPEIDQNTTTGTKRKAPDAAEEDAQTSSSHVLFPRCSSHKFWYEQNGQTIEKADTGETYDVRRETHSSGKRAKDEDIGQGTG